MKKGNTIKCPEYDETVNRLALAKARLKEDLKDECNKAVAALFKSFFELHPDVTAVTWKQFRPYVDNNECIGFRVCTFFVSQEKGIDFSKVDDFMNYPNAMFRDSYDLKSAMRKDLEQLQRCVSGDVFEAAFGNDLIIIATPEGFYSHEFIDHY